MDDRVIRNPGAWAAMGAAATSFLYAAVVALASRGGGASQTALSAASSRAQSMPANWLLAVTGLLLTVAVVATTWRVASDVAPAYAPWLAWAGGLGLMGSAMMAAHGFYDAFRVPILLAQWDAVEARRPAISAMSGLPNPVDPRGLGAFLFIAFFVLALARIASVSLGEPLPPLVSTLGWVHAAVLAVAFVLGLTHLTVLRAAFAGLGLGITGPAWWLMAGRALLAAPDKPAT
jgi:hypothetical protein